jgi:hypothetical protein
LKALLESGRKPEEMLDELYLTVLSRLPTAEEKQTALKYNSSSATSSKRGSFKRREDWVDITWALINSTEFLYRH